MESFSQEDVQLEDLLAFYPSSAKPAFQGELSAKKEFRELASDPGERLRKARGSFFKHQKFVQRFMQHYDQLLLFHETGTGKSCAITAIAEMAKYIHSKGESNIDHAYIIVSNSTLTDRIQREIVCKCTDGVYDIARIDKNVDREARKNLSKWYTIATRQTFAKALLGMTNEDIVRRFSNKIFFIDEAHNLNFEPFKGEIPEEEYSIRKEKLKMFQVSALKKLAKEIGVEVSKNKNDIIEVLFTDPKLSNDKLNEALSDESYKKVKTKKRVITDEINKEEVYLQYWRLFHLIKNSKTVLATATPMLNESAEIRDLMNLLLPSKVPLEMMAFPDMEEFKSRKINISSLEPFLAIAPDVNLADWSDKELERIFRGRTSYVRRLDTGVDVEYMGISISEFKNYPHQTEYDTETKVYIEKMGDFQSKAYIEASKFGGGLRPKERWSSDFVYPDGSYGTRGADKYFTRLKEGEYTVKKKTSRGGKFPEGVAFEKDLKLPISDPRGIFKYSVKFANIISLINSAKGNVFVYSNLTKAGGTIPFSVCLESQGYERFAESQSVFQTSRASASEYCKSGGAPKKLVYKKGLRYFNLHSGITPAKLNVALELMNSTENFRGEYIKVFMTSGIGGEGISLSNVIQIHIIDGDWKHATNYQAESRAIRATSHNDLLEISMGEVKVQVYNHASYTCVPENDEGSSTTPPTLSHPGDLCLTGQSMLSVDVRMYELSEQKDREIKRMERMIKRAAIDCQVHFQRNTRIGSEKIVGKDYTAECDYDVCVYDCWDPVIPQTDYTTYDVYYIDEPTEAIISLLRKYFKNHFVVTLEEVVELIRNDVYPNLYIDVPPELKYVQYAAEKILNEHIPFSNRYGQLSYLQKDGDILFLTLDYPLEDVEDSLRIESDVVNYTEDLIGTSVKALEDITNRKIVEEAEEDEYELENYSVDSADFQENYYALKIGGKRGLAELLEEALEQDMQGTADYLSQNIITKTSPNPKTLTIENWGKVYPYVGSWFKIPEPTWMINRVQRRLDDLSGKNNKPNAAGRKPKNRKRTPDPIKYNPEEMHDFKIGLGPEKYKWGDGGDVYFHTLNSLESSKRSYDYVPKFNNVSGTIRIYKEDEGFWRDANPVEQVVYSLWAQRMLYKLKENYEKEDVYGFFVSGSEPTFRIIPKYEEREQQRLRAMGAREGGKKIPKNKGLSTGRRCVDYSVSQLLRMIAVMGIEPPEMEGLGKFSTKRALLRIQKNGKSKALREEDTKEFIERIWRWSEYTNTVPREKEALCALIQKYLEDNQLIYQTY